MRGMRPHHRYRKGRLQLHVHVWHHGEGKGRPAMTQAWDFVDARILWSGDEGHSIYSMTIEELELSVRSFNALRHNGVHTLADLTQISGPELMRIPNFGRVSLAEIRQVMGIYGLKLKTDPLDRYWTYGGEG